MPHYISANYDRSAAERRTIFRTIREVFYGASLVAAVVAGFWFRFSYTGLSRFYGFATHTSRSGSRVEDLSPYRWTLVGLFVMAAVLLAIMAYSSSRWPGDAPMGAYWLMMVAIVIVPAAFAAYGHYWA